MDELYLELRKVKIFKIKRTILKVLIYTFLTIMGLFIVIPFYWMIISSLKANTEIVSRELTFFPKGLIWNWQWHNYIDLFKGIRNVADTSWTLKPMPFGWMYVNTVVVGFFTTLLTITTVVGSAFAFARLNFKGKELLFSLLLATMMIPGEVFVISNYMTVSKLGWVRTDSHFQNYLALIIPFGTSIFYTFFLRQTFKQIPNELYLAAKVDGTSDFKYLFKVMIPIAKGTITTIIILSMIGTWNAYIWPQFVTNANNTTHFLVSNGLMEGLKGTSEATGPNSILNYQMAASTMVTIPLLIVFFACRKYIMSGVSRSGIKG